MAKQKIQNGLSSEAFQQICRMLAIGAALVLAAIILTTPELDGNRDELLMLVLTLVLALAGGYRLRSSGEKNGTPGILATDELRSIFQDVLRDWIEAREQQQEKDEADSFRHANMIDQERTEE
ncbi:MAG: hypothetical protein IAE89_04405 [Anaerolineae bacterium]|nr:hypothetical protein [Anaerolineae bacterium]